MSLPIPTVRIRGDGIAASCCARLLEHAGLDRIIESSSRAKLPAVMLGETAQKVLRDVFGRDDLFAGLPRIRTRVVAWGPNAKPVALPHSAVVVSEQALLDRVHRPGPADEQQSCAEAAGWTILASAFKTPGRIEHHFGSRHASASPVKLRPETDMETCWIESCESGWLFLLPGGNATGWLLSVGDPAGSMLAASSVIQNQILDLGAAPGTFSSHPRIVAPLSEPGWVACGTGALAFDPLCGDGVGNAAREAILAAAVTRAAIDGDDIERLCSYYQARLLSGFKRHLAVCLEFYRSGGSSHWWENQVRNLEQALAGPLLAPQYGAASLYRLNGFVLESVY